MKEKQWLGVLGLALGLYCCLGTLQIAQKPGLQYDEALHVVGTVHMRQLPYQELTLPHDPDTWIRIAHRWFPLMTVRYTGAIKEYLCLPAFAIFGPRTSLVRLVSMLLGAFGIWGMAMLIRQQVSAGAAACMALLLAVNPSYVDLTVFDNSANGIFMATFGLFCLAFSGYITHQTSGRAFIVGLALGLAVWARANFLWVVLAVFISVLVVARAHLPRRISIWAATAAGSVVGGLPFLIYQIHSGGGTWQALGMFATQESVSRRLLTRSVMFAETLSIDREHRAMWNGPAMPDWQSWLFAIVVILAVWIAITSLFVWARAVALAFVALGAILFLSGEQISEHHLVALLPFASAMVVLAGAIALAGLPSSRYAIAALASVYVGCALYWQVCAVQGLRSSGGTGMWSDGVIRLAQLLQNKYAGAEIKVLDWGLENNLYVITNGGLNMREMFADATREQNSLHQPWMEEVQGGGIFVLYAAGHRQIPAASEGFLEALEESRPTATRTMILQRNSAPYAEVIDVAANTGHTPATISSVRTADPKDGGRLEGFHQVEDGAFRWSKREFAITFDLPDSPADGGVRLDLEIYVPDVLVQKLGSVTLSARSGDHSTAPQTFQQAGSYHYLRDLPRSVLKAGPNRIAFSLDKSLPASPADGRELGIIVVRASLKR